MVDAGIESSDTLIIRKNAEPKLGDIVVALDENNENTLKRYAGIDNVYYGENVPLFRREEYRKSGTMILRVRNRDTALK